MHHWESSALEAFWDIRQCLETQRRKFENAQQRKFETIPMQRRKVKANLQQVDGDGRKVEESTQAPQPRSADGNFIIVQSMAGPDLAMDMES